VKNKDQEVSIEKVDTKTLEIDTRTNPSPTERDPYDKLNDLLLYPNPTTGPITIELDSEQLNIQLINPLGQVLEAIEYNEIGKNMVQIDLGARAAGAYFLSITHDQGTQVEKVAIVHL
jgi:hypothetical protein